MQVTVHTERSRSMALRAYSRVKHMQVTVMLVAETSISNKLYAVSDIAISDNGK